MQFTKFILDNYLETEEGSKGLQFFQNLPKYIGEGDPDKTVARFIDGLLLVPLAEEWFNFNDNIRAVVYENFDEFSTDVKEYFYEQLNNNEGISYRDIIQGIPNESVFLFSESREFAFPYLYPAHFFRVYEICDIFGIVPPPLPKKHDYKAKCLYYLELCNTFYDFRRRHGLSPEEFCVLFYCFSQHFISNPMVEKIPKPLKTYIVGADSGGDHEYLQTISSNSVRYWQGNIETDIGDIILMYELAPQSHISSIWRAITPGYDDPFRYYPGVIWIGHPTNIPPISYEELKADPVWSQKGLVKANMQGVSGRACSREEYDALLSILKKKNFDISVLPSLQEVYVNTNIPLSCERDVEKYLLEPFLKQLGLNENDWLRQMPLRMGRGIRYYPDYVIRADTTRGNERGAIICEAKFRIANQKQLMEDFGQAKSYARRLDCRAFMLASCEGIWLSLAQDDFNFEKVQSFDWQSLSNPDTLHMVKIKFNKLLKKKIKK